MSVCSQWNTEGTSKTKVSQLQVSLFVDQEILRFEITMENSVRMAEVKTLDELVGEFLLTREDYMSRRSF